jgi:glycosyltransferase involved in cell wall biosynthesis
MTNTPKLSIITVNLNNAGGLRKTLNSVAVQTFNDYEHIIIDGGSNDGSVEVIKEYEKQYNGIENSLYWVSEPDKGIYNAMNKGIKVAKGEYCLFLNSGDWLIEKIGLKTIFDLVLGEDIIYCDLQYSNFKTISYPDHITLRHFMAGTIGHPSSFTKTDVLKKFNLFNENYKIIADWEFFIRAIIINQCSYKHINYVLTYFEQNGISTNPINLNLHQQEKKNAFYSLFPMMAEDYYHLIELYKELNQYKNSRLIQFFRKLQQSYLYKKLKKNKS